MLDIINFENQFKNLIGTKLPSKEAYIEDGGIYKGYDYLVTFVYLGHRCGYVRIPEDQIDNYKNSSVELDVHGDITFFKKLPIEGCSDEWIGFDCAHFGDAPDFYTAEFYFKDNEEIIKELAFDKVNREMIKKDMEIIYPGDYSWHPVVRTKEFVVEQCKKLIDQLIQLDLSEIKK